MYGRDVKILTVCTEFQQGRSRMVMMVSRVSSPPDDLLLLLLLPSHVSRV